jgi:hypothetical protein
MWINSSLKQTPSRHGENIECQTLNPVWETSVSIRIKVEWIFYVRSLSLGDRGARIERNVNLGITSFKLCIRDSQGTNSLDMPTWVYKRWILVFKLTVALFVCIGICIMVARVCNRSVYVHWCSWSFYLQDGRPHLRWRDQRTLQEDGTEHVGPNT